MIAENPHHFAVAVPRELPNIHPPALRMRGNACCVFPADTTRPKKPHEKEAVEYHFVTKQQFDADVLNNKYVSCPVGARVSILFC